MKIDPFFSFLRNFAAMNDDSLFSHSSSAIPFSLRGRPGTIEVYYRANTDPILAGFDFLAGLDFNLDLCRGYPVIHARIEDYAGSGYRTVCGWIQIVTRVDRDSHDPARARTTTSTSIDIAPAFQELNLPFTCFGNLPQLFDAPCHNLGDSAELLWTADTFLTTTPLRSRSEAIERLAGFRWGYTETDNPAQTPVLLPLEITGPEVWNGHLPFLMLEYSNWTFQPA
jgi:hypothetical protein